MNIPRPRRLRPYHDRSDSVAKLMPQFAKAQLEFAPIAKDRQEELYDKRTGKTKVRRFASDASILKACKPALLKHAIVLTTTYSRDDEGHQQSCTVWYGDEYLSSVLTVSERSFVRDFCGELTQLRKFCLAHLLCVAADEDDDGMEVDQGREDEAADTAMGKRFKDANLKAALAAVLSADTPERLAEIEGNANRKVEAGQFDKRLMPQLQEAIAKRQGELA